MLLTAEVMYLLKWKWAWRRKLTLFWFHGHSKTISFLSFLLLIINQTIPCWNTAHCNSLLPLSKFDIVLWYFFVLSSHLNAEHSRLNPLNYHCPDTSFWGLILKLLELNWQLHQDVRRYEVSFHSTDSVDPKGACVALLYNGHSGLTGKYLLFKCSLTVAHLENSCQVNKLCVMPDTCSSLLTSSNISHHRWAAHPVLCICVMYIV